MSIDKLKQFLEDHLRIYVETIWENKVDYNAIENWLNCFCDEIDGISVEMQKIYALHILTQIHFLGANEIKSLIKYVYEHFIMYPTKRNIRKNNNDTFDEALIDSEYSRLLSKMLFVGCGTASKSGSHLLYLLRTENNIEDEKKFKVQSELQNYREGYSSFLREHEFNNIFFFDDVTLTGRQAESSLKQDIEKIKSFSKDISVSLITFIATSKALRKLESLPFDNIKCVYELDDSFRCFSEKSRYFVKRCEEENYINKEHSKMVASYYGEKLINKEKDKRGLKPLGFLDSQLLLSLSLNTPNNSLPILWSNTCGWNAIFPRS